MTIFSGRLALEPMPLAFDRSNRPFNILSINR